jgi:ABC-2 type transport system permease protein
VNYAHVAAVGLLQWLQLAVLSALTLLVATYAQTQLFTTVTGFLVGGICHLQYLAQETAARAGAPVSRVIAGLVAVVFPNFQLFSLSEAVGGGGALAWGQVARIALYAGVYVVAACTLAVFCFRRREI